MKTQFQRNTGANCVKMPRFFGLKRVSANPIDTLKGSFGVPMIAKLHSKPLRLIARGLIFTRNFTRPAMRNRLTIYRQITGIYRSGLRNRSVESSVNRQMLQANRQTAPLIDRRSGLPNRQLIINRFPVNLNPAPLNLSPFHHQNAEIYHPARRQPPVRFLESSDNHPTKWRNYPMESANRPIIDRRILRSYRTDRLMDTLLV